MIETNGLGQEQQLVYRIDCDKHTTLGGAPPILVLQKDSVQPPILILSGVQTYPLKSPVIKDERRNKSQGYIIQDERKPPPPNTHSNHLATLPYMSTSRGEAAYPFKQPISASALNDPQQNMHLPTDPSSHDPSYFGQQAPHSDRSFGVMQQTSYSTMSSGDGMIPPGGAYGRMDPSTQGGFSPYYRQHELQPTTGPSPWTTQTTPFNNNMSPEDRMMGYGRGGPMTPGGTTSTMNYPSPTWPYNTNNGGSVMPPYQQQHDTAPYKMWANGTTYDHSHQHPPPAPFPQQHTNPPFSTTVQQPTVINGARRSKSVSFAPLPNFVMT